MSITVTTFTHDIEELRTTHLGHGSTAVSLLQKGGGEVSIHVSPGYGTKQEMQINLENLEDLLQELGSAIETVQDYVGNRER